MTITKSTYKELIDEYKKGKEIYVNAEFISFLKQEDDSIEVISIERISY